MKARAWFLTALVFAAVAIAALVLFVVRVSMGLAMAADGSAFLALAAILGAGFSWASVGWSR